jgi:hypothetical protein
MLTQADQRGEGAKRGSIAAQALHLWILRKLFGLTGFLSSAARGIDGLSDWLCDVVERRRVRAGISMEDIAPLC